MKASWIVVTGLDGSGKTTLVDDLEKWFQQEGKKVLRGRFPNDQYLTKKLLPQSKDAYTDRLLFALDNRLMAENIRQAIDSGDYDIIITQRGYLDSFVHGAVQGYSYEMVEQLNHFSDLPRADVMIHLVAEATVAYERIRDDPDADKFEYPEYMVNQERETRRAYTEVTSGKNAALSLFRGCKNIYMDTTQMSTEETFNFVKARLKSLL